MTLTKSRSRNSRSAISSPVLVLNQNYEPVNVTNARRAITLVLASKAEVLETGSDTLNSPTTSVDCPSVIRLQHMVRRPKRRIPLTRREIFLRDDYTCQYCGLRTRDLTLDHVIPRSKGGANSWENLVSACGPCNHRKGGRTIDQARLNLRTIPREPRYNPYALLRFASNGAVLEGWALYLPA